MHRLFNLSVPGNVIGMIIMIGALCTGVVKAESVEKTSDFLLGHLAFFFVPAAVGLITCLDVVSHNLLAIATIIIVSTIVVMVTAGITVQLLKGGK